MWSLTTTTTTLSSSLPGARRLLPALAATTVGLRIHRFVNVDGTDDATTLLGVLLHEAFLVYKCVGVLRNVDGRGVMFHDLLMTTTKEDEYTGREWAKECVDLLSAHVDALRVIIEFVMTNALNSGP